MTIQTNLRRQADLIAALDMLCLAERGGHARPEEAVGNAFSFMPGSKRQAVFTAIKSALQDEVATGRRVLLGDLNASG